MLYYCPRAYKRKNNLMNYFRQASETLERKNNEASTKKEIK